MIGMLKSTVTRCRVNGQLILSGIGKASEGNTMYYMAGLGNKSGDVLKIKARLWRAFEPCS